jgi:hypothetical protein
MASAKGAKADWFQNILANRHVQIRVKACQVHGLAEPFTDPCRIVAFLELRLQRHPTMIGAILRLEGLPPTQPGRFGGLCPQAGNGDHSPRLAARWPGNHINCIDHESEHIMDTRTLDRKGILAYVLITFGITYAIELALILPGFRADGVPQFFGQLIIAGVMWVPTLATLLTIKLVTHEPVHSLNLRFGPLRPYLIAALVIPAAYALIYGLTWLLSLGQPDWQMHALRSLLNGAGADASALPQPAVFWPTLFVVSMFVAPFINSIFGLGEEIGWRGFLLPRLLPLGKRRAYLLLGIIWGLWHAPLIVVGFNYPGEPILGIVAMIGLTTALGIYINELTLRHQSTILSGWLHGLFNSQGYGIWRILFPSVNPLLGGVTGLIGMGVWLVLGLSEVRRSGATSQQPATAASGAD